MSIIRRASTAISLIAMASPLWAAPPSPDMNCSLQSSPVIDFGIVNPFGSGSVAVSIPLTWLCDANNHVPKDSTLCLYVANDSGGQAQPWRYLENASSSTDLPFNVYNPANSQVVAPATNGVAGTLSLTSLPGGARTGNVTFTLNGELPLPLPPGAGSGLYQTLMANSELRTAFVLGSTCTIAPATVVGSYTLTAQATIDQQCEVSATDLDFGSQPTPILSNIDSTSEVTVRCTDSTPFTVGLSSGLHGSRNMDNAGNLLNYELYKTASRSTVWGNSGSERQSGTGQGISTGIIFTVFGRVFPNTTAPAGIYTDTITVDVEY